jgi:hypothetical protein
VGRKLNETSATRLDYSGNPDGQWGWVGADNFVIATNPQDSSRAVLRHLALDPFGTNQGVVACLPYEIDGTPGPEIVYEVLAEIQLSTGSIDFWSDGNAAWTDRIAVGWMNNGLDRGATFASGRGELAVEVFFANEADFVDGLASYRVMARGEHHILASSETTGAKFDMNTGPQVVEMAWNAHTHTFAGRIGSVDLVTGLEVLSIIDGVDDSFNGDLSVVMLPSGEAWNPQVDGIGFEMSGTGGAMHAFAAIPEPSGLMLLGIVAVALACQASTRSKAA